MLLVDVDEDVASRPRRDPRALHLARLEDHVAVGEDDGRSERSERAEHVECARVETVREGVVHEERRHGQQVRIALIRRPVALEGAEVVGVAELDERSSSKIAQYALGGASVRPRGEVAPEILRMRSLSSSVLSTSTRNVTWTTRFTTTSSRSTRHDHHQTELDEEGEPT